MWNNSFKKLLNNDSLRISTRKLAIFFGLAALILIIVVTSEYVFNITSNVKYFQQNEGKIYFFNSSENGFLSSNEFDVNNYKNTLYKDSSLSIYKLRYRREKESPFANIIEKILPSHVTIFLFKKDKNRFVVTSRLLNGNLNPSSATKIRQQQDLKFSINANFFSQSGKSVGEVIIDRKQYSSASISSGYFKVIDGKPYAGPRSLFTKIKGTVTYSCQAHPSVMKNGKIFYYILQESYSEWWKLKTYRSLVGMTSNGDIMFLVSGERGLLSVREITMIAKKLGIEHATLLDAGAALQYEFCNDDYSINFHATNNSIGLPKPLSKLFRSATGKAFRYRSPVFIGIK